MTALRYAKGLYVYTLQYFHLVDVKTNCVKRLFTMVDYSPYSLPGGKFNVAHAPQLNEGLESLLSPSSRIYADQLQPDERRVELLTRTS